MAISVEFWFLLAAASGFVYYGFSALLSPQRGIALRAAGVLFLLLASSVFHTSIVPARFEFNDFIILGVALGGCAWAAKRLPDLPSCAVFAFFQSLVLLFIFANFYSRDLRIGWAFNTTIGSVLWSLACPVVGYTSLGTFLAATGRAGATKIAADDHPHCEECGYDLFGLPEPRCPECGTATAREKQHHVDAT